MGESTDFYVAHFAETLEEDIPASSESGDEEKETEDERRRTNFDDVPPATLAFHAKQVLLLNPIITGRHCTSFQGECKTSFCLGYEDASRWHEYFGSLCC